MITIGLHCPACGALFDAEVERLDYPPLFCTFCSLQLEEVQCWPSATTGDPVWATGAELRPVQPPYLELRVWLDDDLTNRTAPEGWIHVTKAEHAIRLLAGGRVIELSLDHDLGDDQANGGTDVIDYIVEQQEVDGRDLWPAHGIHLHAGNAYGRDAMAHTIRRYAGELYFVTKTWAGGQPYLRFERPDPREQGEC